MSTGKSSMELRVKPLGIIVVAALLALIGVGVAVWSTNQGKNDAAVEYDDTRKMEGAEILFISSETKKDWLDKQVERFNAENIGKVKVTIEYGETRDVFQNIVTGKSKPTLWAPSSTAWVGRLGDYWQKEKGTAIIDTSDPATYRLYLKTPMVFLTTQDRATFLRPLLSENNKTWDNIRALSVGQIKPSYGEFKYSYADPLNAGSGFMTLSMIITAYGQSQPSAANLSAEQIVKLPGFKQFVKDLNTRFVYDEAAFKGSSALSKSFSADPKKYDLICTYESNALKAALKDPKLAVIYPNPTANVDMSIVLLSKADYLKPEQIAAGKVFMKFLAEKDAMQAGVETMFRTSAVTPGVSLDTELSKVAKQGFQTGVQSAELPPYDSVNSAAAIWREVTKTPAPVQALMTEKAKEESVKAK